MSRRNGQRVEMRWLVLLATSLLTASSCLAQEQTEAPRPPWGRYDDPREQQQDLYGSRDRDREWDRERERDSNLGGGGFNFRPTGVQTDNVIIKEA